MKRIKDSSGTLAKQGAILAITALVVRFIGFIYRVPLTRMIGDIGVGLYSAAYQIYLFFLILSSAGIPVAISKMISERLALKQYQNAHKVFQVSMIMCFALGGFTGGILWFGGDLIANWIENPRAVYALHALAPTLFIVAIMSSLRGYFQGMNTMVPTAISQFIEQIFNGVFSIVMAYLLLQKGLSTNQSIEYGAAGGTLGTGIGALAGLIFLFLLYLIIRPKLMKKIKSQKDIELRETFGYILKRMLLLTLPIIAGSAIFSITNIIDLGMVSKALVYMGESQDEATRLYGILTGKYVLLTNLPVSIATALATASVPSLSASLIQKHHEAVHDKINMAIRLTMLLAMPAAIGLIALGKPILPMLFGAYPEGGYLLQIGSIAIVFFALAQISTAILQGVGRVYIPAKNALYAAIVKTICNFLFIYVMKLSIVGAVLSTIVFSVIICVLDMKAALSITRVKLKAQFIFVKPLFASIIMGVFGLAFYNILFWGTEHNTLSTVGAIIFSIVVYFSVLLTIQGITKKEIDLLPMGKKISTKMQQIGLIKA